MSKSTPQNQMQPTLQLQMQPTTQVAYPVTMPTKECTRLQSLPTHQMAGSAMPSTLDSQPYETLPLPSSTDLSSAAALEELLQQVGLSSENLLETPDPFDQARRPLLPRPPPAELDQLQPSVPKRNKRGRVGAPRLPNGQYQSLSSQSTEKTTTGPTTSEQDTSLKMKIRVSSNAICSANSTSNTAYVNLPNVIVSSTASNNSSTYSDTLVPFTPSCFEFPTSDKLASDLISFLVQVSSQPQSAGSIHLRVLENMMSKQFYPILVSHIDSLYLTYPNRNYITYEFIIRNCLSHLGFN